MTYESAGTRLSNVGAGVGFGWGFAGGCRFCCATIGTVRIVNSRRDVARRLVTFMGSDLTRQLTGQRWEHDDVNTIASIGQSFPNFIFAFAADEFQHAMVSGS